MGGRKGGLWLAAEYNLKSSLSSNTSKSEEKKLFTMKSQTHRNEKGAVLCGLQVSLPLKGRNREKPQPGVEAEPRASAGRQERSQAACTGLGAWPSVSPSSGDRRMKPGATNALPAAAPMVPTQKTGVQTLGGKEGQRGRAYPFSDSLSAGG